MSAAYKQPTSKEDRLKALQGVYHRGYHSVKSLGATSYLIIHSEGNILVDSPKFTRRLASKIEEPDGVRYMFLTDKLWEGSKRFSCDRILHSKDVEFCTADVEMNLEGSGPWNLGDDIVLIHTPGHSEFGYLRSFSNRLTSMALNKACNCTFYKLLQGSVCLFYKPHKILFTGDHLLIRESGLGIPEMINRCPVPTQVDSVKKLSELDFNLIMPGHGRRIEFKNVQEKNAILEAFVREKYILSIPQLALNGIRSLNVRELSPSLI